MNIYKINIPKSIILFFIFSLVLNILRVVIWDKISFIYILWNIFLAFIPFVISYELLNLNNNQKLSNWFFVIGSFLWLIFIPNAPYIITDFIHIGEIRIVPVLYDTFLIFSSSLVGLLFFMYSIEYMDTILNNKYSKRFGLFLKIISFFLISFGIYLGRFLRFNSWDIFTKFDDFLFGLIEIFSNINNIIEALLYTILFFSFIIISYTSWKSLKNDKFI